MEDFTSLIQKSEDLVKLAKSFQNQKKFLHAFLFIDQAVQGYSKALYYATNDDEDLYAALEACAISYGKLREAYRSAAFQTEDQKEEFKYGKFKELMHSWSHGEGFDGIVGLAALKEILHSCIVMLPTSPYAEKFLNGGGDGFEQHILLFGPPGNGKTEIIRSYHQMAKGTSLFCITPADILSKYIGESESNLVSLFHCAAAHSPSIIFFDEIDGLFSMLKRDGNTVSLLNQFLQLMQIKNGVQVVGATNYPWELSDAALRRFEHIVHVPLPNKGERVRLLAKYLGSEGRNISTEQLMTVAVRTKGFSCSDLRRAAFAAIRIPKTKVMKANHFVELPETSKWSPCSENVEGAVKMKFTDIKPCDLMFPQLTINDLNTAVANNPKTTKAIEEDGGDLKKLQEFASRMGCDGRGGGVGCQKRVGNLKYMTCTHGHMLDTVYVSLGEFQGERKVDGHSEASCKLRKQQKLEQNSTKPTTSETEKISDKRAFYVTGHAERMSIWSSIFSCLRTPDE